MRRPRIAIVGAGPAGLFCAYSILQRSTIPESVVVFEKGSAYASRACAIKAGRKACQKCDLCNNMFGVGGCGLFHDTRLSLHPAGSGLRTLLGERYPSFERDAILLWDNAVGDSQQILRALGNINTSEPHNGYISIPVPKGSGDAVTNYLSEYVNKGAALLTNRCVLDVERADGKWALHTAKENIFFDTIIIAVGKTELGLINSTILNNNLATERYYFEFGCRIEFLQNPLSTIHDYFSDYKVKINIDRESSARTYCWNNPGESMCVRHNEIICLDGQPSLRYPNRLSFAVLIRDYTASLAETIEIITQLKELQRTTLRDRPVCQSLFGFLRKYSLGDAPFLEQPFHYTEGDIDTLFPQKYCNLLRKGIEGMGIHTWSGAEKAVIVGPCIEKIALRPCLSRNHESSESNLFFVGDCTGYYRGALQASLGALALACDIRNR